MLQLQQLDVRLFNPQLNQAELHNADTPAMMMMWIFCMVIETDAVTSNVVPFSIQ